MNRPFCEFVSQLNQALHLQASPARVRKFKYATPVLNILVSEGYACHYSDAGAFFIVYFRKANGRLVCKSRPSNRKFVRYRQVGRRNYTRLYPVGNPVVTAQEPITRRKGGIFLMEFI
jgi:hypothetical protein